MAQAIERHCLLSRGEPLLVAVSGGLDSMVLLHVLHAWSQSGVSQLTVAHFDHQLRGRASQQDARFVGRAAAKLGLRFVNEKGNVTGFARSDRMSTEMAARILRHRFLASAARAAGASTIALAHHADDQVESFFLRLFRGAGAEGLAGMDWQTSSPEDPGIRLVRPFLDEPRDVLARYARENHIRFREDPSNRSLAILRNRIRHQLLPLLRRDYQPGLAPVILRTMSTLRGDAEFIANQARIWQRGRRNRRFADLAAALQRQLLRLQLRQFNVTVTFDLVERLRLYPDERVSVGGEFLCRDQAGVVRLTREEGFRLEQIAISLEGRGGETRFGDLETTWRFLKLRGGPPGRRNRRNGLEVFDADRVGPVILLRHWHPGDRFRPSGLPRAAKLQNLFVNQRVPRETRRRLVIATTAAGELFWVEGLRIAEGFKLDKASRRGLKWQWRRVNPR